MNGKLSSNDPNYTILNLTKLRFINLSNNKISDQIPRGERWKDFDKLEMIEFQFNNFGGSIPEEWKYLSSLTYLNLSENKLTGEIPILWGAEKLEGIDLTNNSLVKFPWEYFREDRF